MRAALRIATVNATAMSLSLGRLPSGFGFGLSWSCLSDKVYSYSLRNFWGAAAWSRGPRMLHCKNDASVNR